MRFPVLAVLAALAAGLGFGVSAASAQTTVHTFTAPGPYNNIGVDAHPGCDIPTCTGFAPGDVATGSFTTASPLPPNASGNFLGSVQSFAFSDGVTTYVSGDPNVRVRRFDLTTDGSGQITAFDVQIQRWRMLPAAVGNGPDSRLDMIGIATANTGGEENMECFFAIGVSFAGVADSCNGWHGSLDYTFGQNASGGTWSSVSAVTVPTLGEWAMILFALLLVGGAAVHLQRRNLARG